MNTAAGRRLLHLLWIGVIFLSVANAQSPTDIRTALTDDDRNGVADRSNNTLTIRGVVIETPRMIDDDQHSRTYIQDGTSGVRIVAAGTQLLVMGLELGDEVEVRGRLGHAEGRDELKVTTISRLRGGSSPQPVRLTIADTETDHYRGKLISLTGNLVQTVRDSERSTRLTDRTGTIEVILPSRFFRDPEFASQFANAAGVEVVGILERRIRPDGTTSTRIRPRETADVRLRLKPPYTTIALGGIALVLLTSAVHFRLKRKSAEQHSSQLRTVLENLKESEQSLRRSEMRYRELFENANDMLCTIDLAGNITSINKVGEQITGYSYDASVKIRFEDIIAPEQVAACRGMLLQKLSGDKRVTVYETEFLSKDGRRVPVEISSRLIDEFGRPSGVHITARDVSDRRRLEEQFRQAQKMEAVGRLSGGVAHDFNNVLTIISGYGQLLMDNPLLDTSAREHVTAIKNAANRGAGLTSQLLAFSRKQVLQPRVLNLNSVIKNSGEMLSRLIGEDVAVITKLCAEISPVKVDPTQIEQVLMNLAVNARDAMPNGGQLIIETSKVFLTEDGFPAKLGAETGDYVMLSISDTGCGMTDEVKSRIFEPFFSTKPRDKGTGLGLATVYGVIRQSGGSIQVYSEVGHGTTFKIYLRAIECQYPLETVTGVPCQRLNGCETILVVEDEDGVRNMLEQTLTRLGYSVLTASQPDSAIPLANLHAGTIDLLLSDVIMPGMNGPDMARRLTNVRPGLRVLFMSGYTDEAILHQGVLDSSVNFIGKPFTTERLSIAIRRALDEPISV